MKTLKPLFHAFVMNPTEPSNIILPIPIVMTINGLIYVREVSLPSGDSPITTIISFKPDGSIMYVGSHITDNLVSYTLEISWDISSTLTKIDNISLPNQPNGVIFKPDGSKMITVSGVDNDLLITEYLLSSPWVINNPTILNQKSYNGRPTGISVNNDGTILFIVNATFDQINEFTLPTAWDITDISQTGSFNITTETNPNGISVFNNGLNVLVNGTETDGQITEYTLSSEWDISTITDERLIDHPENHNSNIQSDMFMLDDKLYIADANGIIYEYKIIQYP